MISERIAWADKDFTCTGLKKPVRAKCGQVARIVRDRDSGQPSSERGDFQHCSVIREVARDQGIGRGNSAAPRLEVVKVAAIGALGCRSDAGFNIRLDRSGSVFAVNCKKLIAPLDPN
jgi:hypothetical protein